MDQPTPYAVEKHPAAIRWMHWINFPLLFIMIWSGLRVYWANDTYAIGIGGWDVALFPESWYQALGLDQRLARGIAFHLTIGWLFVLNGLAYVLYLGLSGQWRHLVPDRADLANLWGATLHDLGLRKVEPAHGRYNAAQQVAYTAVVGMGVVIVLSGFAIYKPATLSLLTRALGGYESARLIHFSTSMAFVAFVVVHVLQVARAGWRKAASMITGYEVDDPGDDPPVEEDHEEVPA